GLVLPRCGQGFSGQHPDRENDDGIEPPASCKRWGRGAAVDAHHHTARFHTLEAPHQCVTTRAVQHHVTFFGHLFKTFGSIVDGDVRAQTLHHLHIAFPHGGKYRCAHMTGQLDGHASNATAARVNQHALVGAKPSDLHQSLPRRQRNQRKGGGFFECHVRGFDGGG